MYPEKPRRRVPLGPVLVAAIAVVFVCAGAIVVVANVVSGLSSRPETSVVACDVEEHRVPFPNEAGFAQMIFKVTNLSSADRIYVVGVVVKTVGGEAVGSAEHRVGVPAYHTQQQTWRVTLTRPGGRVCEVSKVDPE